jgi:cytoskeletal protein RodZ
MSTQALGKQLKQAREARGWSLDDAAGKTFIKPHYIKALEAGDFGALPSAVQVRGFIRTYAGALALDSQALFDLLQSQENAEPLDAPLDAAVPAPMPTANTSAEVTAADIFAEIAAALSQRRDMLGLSIQETAEFTHIPRHYLDLIESGDFDGFPSPVQARGMLGNYADFLEMDSSAVLLRYADGLQTRLAVRQAERAPAQRPRRTEPRPERAPLLPPWLRTMISPDLVLVVVVAILLVGFFTWGFGRALATQEALRPNPTAPGLASVLLPTGAPTATLTPEAQPSPTAVSGDESLVDEGGEETGTPELPALNDAPVQVFLVVRQRAFLRVTVDGAVEFEGRVVPGDRLTYAGQQSIELLTGNGAAFQVFYNEDDLGPLGLFGEIVNVVYTADGLITPTATISPTPDPALITPTLTLEPDEE